MLSHPGRRSGRAVRPRPPPVRSTTPPIARLRRPDRALRPRPDRRWHPRHRRPRLAPVARRLPPPAKGPVRPLPVRPCCLLPASPSRRPRGLAAGRPSPPPASPSRRPPVLAGERRAPAPPGPDLVPAGPVAALPGRVAAVVPAPVEAARASPVDPQARVVADSAVPTRRAAVSAAPGPAPPAAVVQAVPQVDVAARRLAAEAAVPHSGARPGAGGATSRSSKPRS